MGFRFSCTRDCCCDQNGAEVCHKEGQALLDAGLIGRDPGAPKAGERMSDGKTRLPACAYCDKRVPGLERDHVVPRSRGGPDNATNIVMACKSCNASKGDLTPSEWLADRCPDWILQIEQRVNQRLAADFSKRDKRPTARRPHADYAPARPTVYAIYVHRPRGRNGEPGREEVCYFGEVAEDRGDTIRIDTYSALDGGRYGELVDAPRSSCRLFSCRDRFGLVLGQLTADHYRRSRRRRAVKSIAKLPSVCGRTKRGHVHVFWDHDKDERVFHFVDELPPQIRKTLIAVHEHKGGLWLVWDAVVPQWANEFDQVSVLTGYEDAEDVWQIVSSVAV